MPWMSLLNFLRPVYNAASFVALPACIFLAISVVSLKHTKASLLEKNGALEAEVATVRAEIKLQNDAVDQLKRETEEYKTKLGKAYAKNEESKKELTKRLAEIEQLKLPVQCNGKIETLKQELIKSSAGWKP